MTMSPSRWQRWTLGIAAGVLLPLAVAGCSRSSSPAAGRLSVDGQAEITRPGEDRKEVTGSRNLKTGDRVRVRQGTAVIQLPDDRRLELRVGTDVEMQRRDGPERVRPTLMSGDLLVVSDDRPLAVSSSGADMAVQGDARISRGVVLLVAVYEGTAQLSSQGSSLTVPALRQAALPGTGQFPTKARPLEYSASDAWDQRYLSDAVELGKQLSARSEGFSAQLGPADGRSYEFFRDLFPRLVAEPGFTAPLIQRGRPPGETLVGAAITLEGTRGAFAERWAAVFGFRDEGAHWGLVALDQRVSRAALLDTIEAAVGRGPTLFAEGPPGRTPDSLAPPSRGGSTATTVVRPRAPTTAAPPRNRGPAPAGVPPTTRPPTPPTTRPTGPVNTGAPLVDETVGSLVETLSGLLRSLGGQ